MEETNYMRIISSFISSVVLVNIVFLLGCGDTRTEYHATREGPVAYGANGLSAPAVLKVKANAPRSMGYPAFAMANVPVGEVPVLPAVQQMTESMPHADHWQGIHDPLRQGVNPDLVVNRALPVAGMNPAQPMPIEQQVYGGVYGKKESAEPYLYLAGDVLKIVVKGSPEFCGDVKVAEDGEIQLPGTEDYVHAQGMDSTQVANRITDVIRPYVRKHPVVKVTTLEARGGYYYIFGGVKNQGRFPIGKRPITLSEAVFRADSALLTQVKSINAQANAQVRDEFKHMGNGWLGEVVVVTPHRVHPNAQKYNVAEALFGGLNKNNPVIKPGQIVLVRDKDDPELEKYIQSILFKDNLKLMLETPPYYKKDDDAQVVVNNYNRINNTNENHVKGKKEKDWSDLSIAGKVATIFQMLL